VLDPCTAEETIIEPHDSWLLQLALAGTALAQSAIFSQRLRPTFRFEAGIVESGGDEREILLHRRRAGGQAFS